MIFTPARISGAFLLAQERKRDERGYFARTWCARELAQHGLSTSVAQCSVSHNLRRGTLRGMHWQSAPRREVKLVRCTRGLIWDVILDLRRESDTYLEHFGVELSAESGAALYIPEGVAHGFVTLVDDSEVSYQMSEFYEPSLARGVRWNDPAFGIEWPVTNPILHPRDAEYPDYIEMVAR